MICICPADVIATSLSLALLKSHLVLDYPGCPRKEAVKWVSVLHYFGIMFRTKAGYMCIVDIAK